jgi:hypothetical protein
MKGITMEIPISNNVTYIPAMKCPCCRTTLVPWKELRLETLDEHVCNPNGVPSLKWSYRCPSTTCKTNGLSTDGVQGPIVFWNEGGELYASRKFPYDAMKSIPFIDNNDAPFGTFERRMKVEIYKKDENKHLHTFTGILWKGWKVNSQYRYTSNENGDILSRKLGFEWISPDGCIKFGPPPFDGIHMMIFCLKRTFINWKQAREFRKTKKDEKIPDWFINQLKDSVKERGFRNPEWWRKVNAFFAKLALENLKISLDEQSQSW